MKLETYFKKAMETADLSIRLSKLERVCLMARPYSAIWEEAKTEVDKLRASGVKCWCGKDFTKK